MSNFNLKQNGAQVQKAIDLALMVPQLSGDIADKVSVTQQTLTDEQKAQARKNIGAENLNIEILESDPTGEELYEGRAWILKKSISSETTLTAPVISLKSVNYTSISIVLNNASYNSDGDIVTAYKVYINGTLYATTDLAAGTVYTLENLNENTTYNIIVCGVEGYVISPQSNTVSVTTPDDNNDEPIVGGEIVYVASIAVSGTGGAISIYENTIRALALYTAGKKSCLNTVSDDIYYPIPVPEDATSCTVVCDGFRYGFNGWNLSDDGVYTYALDSGWKDSGTNYTFEAGATEFVTIVFRKTTDTSITDADLTNITISFA